MKKRIAIDMDEVIADTLKARLERYQLDYGIGLGLETLHGKHIYDVIPEAHRQQVRDVMDEHDFFRHLTVFPDAQEVIAELAKSYDIFIATAAMEVPFSFNAKYEWLLEHFPFLDTQHFVFCGNKGIIAADYLIDDNPKQLHNFRGQGIMFSSPANIGLNEFPRVHNWLEVRAFFKTQIP
jgi:5'(3')-deoxyribonucleotidase